MRRLFMGYDGTFSERGVACSWLNPELEPLPANELMRRTMQKLLLSAIGLLLIAALIDQPVAAGSRHARRAQCVAAPVTRQLHDAPGSANCSAAQQSAYVSHTGSSPPAAGESKSCDRFWCYEN